MAAPKKRRKQRADSDLPTARSLQSPEIRELIPRSLKQDFHVNIFLAGLQAGVELGHLQMQEIMAAAQPRPAQVQRARPEMDLSQYGTEAEQPQQQRRPLPRIDTAPEDTRGEDPDRDAEDGIPADDEGDPEPVVPQAPSPDLDESIGVTGYPQWIEDHYVAETVRMSTNPALAKQIAHDVMGNKVGPDPNGMPPERITYVLETALINQKIHSGVEGDGFRDHHQGRSEELSDSVAAEAAGRMGSEGAAAELGL